MTGLRVSKRLKNEIGSIPYFSIGFAVFDRVRNSVTTQEPESRIESVYASNNLQTSGGIRLCNTGKICVTVSLDGATATCLEQDACVGSVRHYGSFLRLTHPGGMRKKETLYLVSI
jgi:hypothetical protein